MPMPAHEFRAAEEELRQFPLTLIALKQRREEAMTPHSRRNDVGGGKRMGASDPTYSTTARLCARDIREMERWVNAIADVYAALGEEMRSMVRLLYWQRNSAAGVADWLGVDVSTLRDWREVVAGAVRWRVKE